jgi:hypothetical protein
VNTTLEAGPLHSGARFWAGRPISSQDGGCWGSGSGYSNLPVSTAMVEEAEGRRRIGPLEFLSPVFDDFSTRQLGLPSAPSCNCVKEGRLVPGRPFPCGAPCVCLEMGISLAITLNESRYPPRRSRRRKCALHRVHVLLPSLWFNAWRCRCPSQEKDFPQSAKLQLNFFSRSESCTLELVVENEETDEVLVLVGAMTG